jgi:hypothetical protein
MISAKPREEFQFVKVLTVTELYDYIRALSPVYSVDETQKIADHLIKLNRREIVTNRKKLISSRSKISTIGAGWRFLVKSMYKSSRY